LTWLGLIGRRAIVFHETIDGAEESYDFLRQHHVRAGLDHSGLAEAQRKLAMEGFRKERLQVLVAVRALDEGVDVPDAAVAVIAAGSRSRRQRIQRFGRVLRPAEGKEAVVITILVRKTPEEAAVGGQDAALLGSDRVRHYRWPGVPVDEAVLAPPSSYRPARPAYTIEDVLTLQALGLWEAATPGVSRRANRAGGGYSAREGRFSPNAWYSVDEVRADVGMPEPEFNRRRAEVRRTYWLSLDPAKRDDPTLIHGTEIDAVRRGWHNEERSRSNVRRRC
jgi:hypothetical protein